MKVKLLKKIRKRFEISHLPQGFIDQETHYDFNLFSLKDKSNVFFGVEFSQCGFDASKSKQFCVSKAIFNTEKECVDYLKSLIIIRLKKEGYRNRKDIKINNQVKKVWYL